MPPRALVVLLPALLLPVVWPPWPAHADGAWRWPVGPRHVVVRGFDPPAHDWLPGNRGVDLAAAAGAAVAAAGPGTVSFAGRIAGVGVVAVAHPGGLETTYEPVTPVVRRGASVRAGTLLGHLSAHGAHCKPATCLHWGLRRGGDYLDPLSLVGAGPVRLLPMLTRPDGSWLAPAAGGASVGSSAVILGWAAVVSRRRRRAPSRSGSGVSRGRR